MEREQVMDDEGLVALTYHYARAAGVAAPPERKVDAKSHAALEDSRSFAPDIQAGVDAQGKPVYAAPPSAGRGPQEDSAGPFRYHPAGFGYSAGRR